MSNEDNQPHRGGYSLSGSGPAESLPAEWARSIGRGARGQNVGSGGGNGFSSSNRIGRIGGLGGGGGNSSRLDRAYGNLTDTNRSSCSIRQCSSFWRPFCNAP